MKSTQEICLKIITKQRGSYLVEAYKDSSSERIHVGRFIGNLTQIRNEVSSYLNEEVKLKKLPFSGWY